MTDWNFPLVVQGVPHRLREEGKQEKPVANKKTKLKIVQVIPQGQNSALAIAGVNAIMDLAINFGLPIEYQMLSTTRKKTVPINQFSLKPHGQIEATSQADIIIIPSILEAPEQVFSQNLDLIKWLKHMRQNGSKLVSLCTGAYLLAETGLLNGQEASSHISAIQDLMIRYPSVKWLPDRIITDQNGIYTSGGSLSSFNVLIYILGKYFDKATASKIAKTIQLDYPRQSQKPFYIFSNQKKHKDEQILAIQQYFEKNMNNTIPLDSLAQQFGMSRRNLHRRFKLATGLSPKDYLQKLKVEQAKEWLEAGRYSIKEIIYKIGYNDQQSFRQVFKKTTGLLPNEYRKKFRS